jgi:hypothetical protein
MTKKTKKTKKRKSISIVIIKWQQYALVRLTNVDIYMDIYEW